MIDRRKLLTLGASAIISSSVLKKNKLILSEKHKDQESVIPDDLTILFQGDSITDAGRAKDHYYANQGRGMGIGYVNLTASQLLHDHPDKNLKIYNRGISGHKVFQLSRRWEEDCLQLSPDVLSIMIGVNDFWHTLTHGYKGTIDTYKDDLRQLLDRTYRSLPSVKLIIGEPFAVAGGSAVSDFFDSTFDAYRHASSAIADEYKASFIPYHSIFQEAVKIGGAAHWCPDGVHPSLAGSALMKDAWIKAFNGLKL